MYVSKHPFPLPLCFIWFFPQCDPPLYVISITVPRDQVAERGEQRTVSHGTSCQVRYVPVAPASLRAMCMHVNCMKAEHREQCGSVWVRVTVQTEKSISTRLAVRGTAQRGVNEKGHVWHKCSLLIGCSLQLRMRR